MRLLTATDALSIGDPDLEIVDDLIGTEGTSARTEADTSCAVIRITEGGTLHRLTVDRAGASTVIKGKINGVPGVVVDFSERTVDHGGSADNVLNDRDVVLVERVADGVIIGVEFQSIAADRELGCRIARVYSLERHEMAGFGRAIGTFVFVKHEHESVGATRAICDLIVEVDFPDPACQVVICKSRRSQAHCLASNVPHLLNRIPVAFLIRIPLLPEDCPLTIGIRVG